MVKPNKTKAKLKLGGIAFGVKCKSARGGSGGNSGPARFDYIVIDWEHFLFDGRQVEECIRAADLYEVTAFVRLHNDAERIQHVLKAAGAQGIVVARVNTVDHVRNILYAAKFHPHGQRTIFYNGRGGDFGLAVAPGQSQQWTVDSNNETMVGCIIEEITGYNNLPAILAFPEVDMIHLGRWDLSHQMGWPETSEVDSKVDHIIAELAKAGKAVSATWHGTMDRWEQAVAKGNRMFTVSPRGYFKNFGSQFLRQAKEAAASQGLKA